MNAYTQFQKSTSALLLQQKVEHNAGAYIQFGGYENEIDFLSFWETKIDFSFWQNVKGLTIKHLHIELCEFTNLECFENFKKNNEIENLIFCNNFFVKMDKQTIFDHFKAFEKTTSKATAQVFYAAVVKYAEQEELPTIAVFYNPTPSEVKTASEMLDKSNVKSEMACIATVLKSLAKLESDNVSEKIHTLNALVFHLKRFYYKTYESHL